MCPATTQDMWVWDETVVTDLTKRNALFSFASSKGINGLYLECEGLVQSNPNALRDFVVAAQSHSMTVDFLFGAPEWALTPNHQVATALATATVQYTVNFPTARPRAVHYDVEPYLLPEWATDENGVANQYLDLISELKAIVAPASLQLTMDIPFWFDGESITRSGVVRPLNQWVQDGADKVVLMDYRDTAQLIIQFAADEIAYGDTVGKKVVIGVETQCGQEPEYVSFCEEGNAAMQAALRKVRSAYAKRPSFDGTAIHHYGSYVTMAP